jgi:pathogenesis-related protein 1
MRNLVLACGLLAMCGTPAPAIAQALVCPETPILRDGFEPLAPAPSNLTVGDAAATLNLHNCMRSQVSPPANPALPPLAWSTSLAASAQAWTDNCVFQPQAGLTVGQNLAASSVSSFTASQATQLWIDDREFYDYEGNSCAPGRFCGYYTQVVWRSTTQVGCGRTLCATGSPVGSGTWIFVVCRYDPRGSLPGQRPY